MLPRVVGAFYAIGGWLAVKAVASGDMLDRMLTALKAARPGRNEQIRRWVLGAVAVMTCLSGIALVLMSRWALPLFLVNLLAQAGWIAWARTAFPPEDEDELRGRRAVTNAAVGYTAATALVVWLDWRGTLAPFSDPVVPLVLGLAAAGLGAWLIKQLSWNPGSLPDDWDELPEIEQPLFRQPTRLRLAPAIGDWVLWDADDGRGLDPFLYLPEDIAERIALWESAHEAALDPDDVFGPAVFADLEAANAHALEGRLIAMELEKIYGPGSVDGPIYEARTVAESMTPAPAAHG